MKHAGFTAGLSKKRVDRKIFLRILEKEEKILGNSDRLQEHSIEPLRINTMDRLLLGSMVLNGFIASLLVGWNCCCDDEVTVLEGIAQYVVLVVLG